MDELKLKVKCCTYKQIMIFLNIFALLGCFSTSPASDCNSYNTPLTPFCISLLLPSHSWRYMSSNQLLTISVSAHPLPSPLCFLPIFLFY